MKLRYCLLHLLLPFCFATRHVGSRAGERNVSSTTPVFVNEFHYANKGDDVGEGVEIVHPSNVNILEYSLEFYNGGNGNMYKSVSLTSCTEGTPQNRLSFCHMNVFPLQNGGLEGDGLALVDGAGQVVQFLSYEGTVTAANGAAAGMTSTNIGVVQVGNPVAHSLQLGGTGCVYEDFAWQDPRQETFGSVNAGQIISCQTSTPSSPPPTPVPSVDVLPPQPTPVPTVGVLPPPPRSLGLRTFINEMHYENSGIDVGEFLELAFPAGTAVSAYSIQLYNGDIGRVLRTISLENATFGSTTDGVSFWHVDATPMQQGGGGGKGDGIALVDPYGQAVQFISYEGSFLAKNGAAVNMTSADVGVNENGAPVGTSLQLGGVGCIYSDFVWQDSRSETKGTVNAGQTITCDDFTSPPSPSPTLSPTTPETDSPSPPPSQAPFITEPEFPNSLRFTNACSPTSKCGKCEGDCYSEDDNCQEDLVCLSRSGDEPVVGCVTGGMGDVYGASYCHRPPVNGPVTYVPGQASVIENELLLSTGLTARRIAIAGEKVEYADGSESDEPFHRLPDGGAVFADSETGGWIYVSNSESNSEGGVGAITFDSEGEVVGYKRLLNNTRRNCGGGKTWYNTWRISNPGGQVWEVDPWGNTAGRRTIMGGLGDKYESAAYDSRNETNPTFYVTTDKSYGPLRKFTPDAASGILEDPPDYSNLLHDNSTGTAMIEYLLLSPDPSNTSGTFTWTGDLSLARENAFQYYPKSEGIDIRDGTMFVTCKRYKHLFIFDLDNFTYERQSTRSGAFDKSPDQVARILGGDEGILYFCEDGGDVCGVHGRDSSGNFYTILDSIPGGSVYGETTGLAFSPDARHMYVSFQHPGFIYDITRTDGYSFAGQRLDIKYHANEDNIFGFDRS